MNVEDFTIRSDATLIDALAAIDRIAKGFVLVCSSKGELDGIVTDGDIRRQLIAGKKRSASVKDALNPNPITLSQPYSYDDVKTTFLDKKIRHLPILDANGVLIDVLYDTDYLQGTQKYDNAVVIMAGGIGSRLMPLTSNCPKPMVKVAGIPMIERIITNLRTCGFHRLYLTVNYKKDVLMEYFGDGSRFNVDISYVEEEKRMGTAGSLQLIAEDFENDVIVTNGDILCGINFAHMLEQHKQSGAKATMAVRDFSSQVPFGVVNVKDKRVQKIEEKPTYNYLVSAGINVLSPEALKRIPKNVFYDMPTVFDDLLQDEKETYVYHINEYWFDLGTKKDLDIASEFIASREA